MTAGELPGVAPSAGQSSYLQYLPPVLWQDDPPPPQFSLGAFLRIVEKVLHGIDDGIPLRDDLTGVDHPAITSEIARVHRVLDPWTTPSAFLPWLSSWVALEFPTLQGTPLWDEYQRRKVTADITEIYRLRGRKAGLNRYLDLYSVGRTRPRVALDDGCRLLQLTPVPGAVAPVTGLVTQGPVVQAGRVRLEGVTRPWCVATASDHDVFVGDIGVPAGAPIQVASRVWHLDPAGRPDMAGTPPAPRPLAPDTLPLTQVVALALRPATATVPAVLYALDRPGRLYAVSAPVGQPWQAATATLLTSLATPGTSVWPVAMALDLATGDLLVLDRGDGAGTPNPPKVILVHPAGPTLTRHPLPGVTEPLSLALDADGTLLIGDGGDQDPADPSQFSGNLVRVEPAAGWTQTALLPADNPLVAPTGIARTSDGRLYVLDAGLKPFSPSATDPFICPVAEPAAVYDVDLTAPGPVLRRITEPAQFVYPTGLAAAGQRLLVCDPGQPEVSGLESFRSRVQPFLFDVVIHFTESRLPADPASRQQVLNQAVGNIRTIIDAQKPAHTVWNLITAI